MTTPRSGRRRSPAGMASACAQQAERDRVADFLYHLTDEDVEAIGFHFSHCCAMPLPDRVRYLAARMAERAGLRDPRSPKVQDA